MRNLLPALRWNTLLGVVFSILILRIKVIIDQSVYGSERINNVVSPMRLHAELPFPNGYALVRFLSTIILRQWLLEISINLLKVIRERCLYCRLFEDRVKDL